MLPHTRGTRCTFRLHPIIPSDTRYPLPVTRYPFVCILTRPLSRICAGSLSTIQPNRQPGTKYFLDMLESVRTGTGLGRDARGTYSAAWNAMPPYTSSAMMGSSNCSAVLMIWIAIRLQREGRERSQAEIQQSFVDIWFISRPNILNTTSWLSFPIISTNQPTDQLLHEWLDRCVYAIPPFLIQFHFPLK